MDTQTIVNIAVPIGVGAGVIVVLVLALYAFAKARTNTTPTLQAVIDAIRPFILQGIFAGEKIALSAMDDLKVTLSGLDRKSIADSIWNLLPDSIYVGPVRLPVSVVKTLVPLATFEQLVEAEYQKTDAFITANESYLKKQVDALKVLAPQQTPVTITYTTLPQPIVAPLVQTVPDSGAKG